MEFLKDPCLALFINDIESCFLNSNILIFADDMKIFKPISDAADAISLQEDLNRLDEYCKLNNLDLNPSKCLTITFTRKINPLLHTYSLKGQALNRAKI